MYPNAFLFEVMHGIGVLNRGKTLIFKGLLIPIFPLTLDYVNKLCI